MVEVHERDVDLSRFGGQFSFVFLFINSTVFHISWKIDTQSTNVFDGDYTTLQ
jgi:hypothetical protein